MIVEIFLLNNMVFLKSFMYADGWYIISRFALFLVKPSPSFVKEGMKSAQSIGKLKLSCMQIGIIDSLQDCKNLMSDVLVMAAASLFVLKLFSTSHLNWRYSS